MNQQEDSVAAEFQGDDVEGHKVRQGHADAESAEGDDVEGHKVRQGHADAESAEGDDTEGHVYVQEPDEAGGRSN